MYPVTGIYFTGISSWNFRCLTWCLTVYGIRRAKETVQQISQWVVK